MRLLRALTLLPPVLLAQAPPNGSPDQYGLQQTFEVTALANTTLRVRNELPVKVAVQVEHTRRGKDGFSKSTYTWDSIDPNKTSNEITVSYETLRKTQDWWRAKIIFQNPTWNSSTFDCPRTIFLEDEKPTMVLRNHSLRFEFGDVWWYWTEKFAFVESNKRADPNLDSFFFVETSSDYKDVTSIEVQLETQQGFVQRQNFTLGGGNLKNTSAPLPFFFQTGGSKNYNETWSFKINRKGLRPLVAENVTCLTMTADMAGQRTGLFFDKDSWFFGPGTRCFDFWRGTTAYADEL